MDRGTLPVILIEVVLVLGGVLAFAWWQLRSVARDRKKAAEAREQHKREGTDRADVDGDGRSASDPGR